MTAYDPERQPDSQVWLGLSENTRLLLVLDYHAREQVASPNARLHAAIHVVVENQIALADAAVRETVARLQSKGLSRHEALHRIGNVVTDLLLEASDTKAEDRDAAGRSYEQRLAALLAPE